jgi:hypothetical protein
MRKLFSTLALWSFYIPAAYAQDLGTTNLTDVANQANLGAATPLPIIIGNVVRIFIGLLGIIFVLLTIYAGYLYLTAQGEEDKVTHAKETLQRGVIGLVIIMTAYTIATFVINALMVSTRP